jgi:hypothetical protein
MISKAKHIHPHQHCATGKTQGRNCATGKTQAQRCATGKTAWSETMMLCSMHKIGRLSKLAAASQNLETLHTINHAPA